MMKSFKLSRLLAAVLVLTTVIPGVTAAAPIFSDANVMSVSGAADAPLFSHMRLTGNHVAFRGEDGSIMLGYYASGPWRKNEFLRAWGDIPNHGGGGPPNFVPIQETVSQLPEPSTLALLGLGLVAFGALKGRRSKR